MANQKPAAEVRIGAVKAVIWKNEGESSARYAVSFERLYKSGEEWKL